MHCRDFVRSSAERVAGVCLCLLVLFVFAGPLVHGQSLTQTIQGLVTDATGAVVPGAKVTITNVGTGVSRVTTTNETGNYSFQLVEVGNHDVRCELEGFRAELARGVRVDTGAQVRRDFTLEVGEVTETVEVAASAVTLNTENATVGALIENKRITELPLNGRNVVQLAVLVPGVQFGARTGLADGQGGFPIPGASFSVSANGQREIHQVVTLDGTDAKDPRIHITPFVPSIEAIEEFKIQTNAYSAEIGFGGGAVVNITMKSGTNAFHGTLFEFLRNNALDAENYFLNFEVAPTARREQDARRRNQFGFFVSGPIVRNKTFWSFNWEGRREVTTGVGEGYFPTPEVRSGDFSELLSGTINPTTGRLFRNPIVVFDAHTGEPYPNNVIPSSRFHPGIVNNIYSVVPSPQFRDVNGDPLGINFRRPLRTPITSNQYFGRVDHHFSDADRIFVRMALDRSSTAGVVLNPNFGSTTTSPTNNIASQWIHTFNQNTINEFRFGFQLNTVNIFNPRTNDESFDMDALGIGEVRVVNDGNRELFPVEQGYPNMGLYNVADGGNLNELDSWQVGDHISLIKGSHNVKMGFEFYRIAITRLAANVPTGSMTFGGNESGLNHASFLLGLPTGTQTAEGWPATYPRANRHGTYINDDWKMTSKLTVNLGLRFDYNGVPVDAEGLWRTPNFPGEGNRIQPFIDPATGQPIPTFSPEFVDERGAVKLWDQQVKFFMPRIGIAYRPTEKWVVRMGGGWFDNLMHQNTWTILNLNPPKSGRLQYNSVTDVAQRLTVTGIDGASYNVQTRKYRAGQPVITLDDPFLTEAGAVATRGALGTLYAPPDTKDGDVWKWSFDVQRELPLDTSLTVGYVGSKGSHVGNAFTAWNQAQPSPDTNFQARRPFRRIYDPATPALGIQALGQIRYLDSYQNSFHHGMQVKLDKRFSNGVAFGVSHTWSKSTGNGEGGGNEEGPFQNPLFDRTENWRMLFDQKHNFVAHWVWEMPGGNLPGPLKHILGGWQSNGIVSLRTGFPFTVTQGNDLNTGDGTIRPDRIGSAVLEDANRKLWFDPLAFTRVTCNIPSRQDLCHFGSSGRAIFDTPAQKNLDFGFFKNFQVTETWRLQFRSEFFNALNTPYFGTPNTVGFTGINVVVPDANRMGEIRNIRTPMRIIQFALKLSF